MQLLDEKWICVHYTAIHTAIIKSAKKQTVSFRMNKGSRKKVLSGPNTKALNPLISSLVFILFFWLFLELQKSYFS